MEAAEIPETGVQVQVDKDWNVEAQNRYKDWRASMGIGIAGFEDDSEPPQERHKDGREEAYNVVDEEEQKYREQGGKHEMAEAEAEGTAFSSSPFPPTHQDEAATTTLSHLALRA